MLKINYFNDTDVNMNFWKKFANKILKTAYEYFNFNYDIELSITFVDDLKAQQINQKYRNHSYIADVTSFSVEMTDQEIKAIGFRELGDMFINLSEAKRKAIKYEHDLNSEMGFLFVHGFLHLLGYDHEDLDDEKIMFDLQDQILKLNNLVYIIKFNEEDYLESN